MNLCFEPCSRFPSALERIVFSMSGLPLLSSFLTNEDGEVPMSRLRMTGPVEAPD